ncbi:hypothetical protein GCM10028805_27190 [Spirosoma harenae]
MNLYDLFNTIASPDGENMYNAEPVTPYSPHRLAKTQDSYPALLIRTEHNFSQKPRLKLQNLKVLTDIKCQVNTGLESYDELFTVIIFTSSDPELQKYFLRITETLIDALPALPTEQHVLEILFRYTEVFKLLTEVARKPALGLWAELFVIAESDMPAFLVESWHTNPTDTFDFQWGNNRLEVKATVQDRRIHTFSMEQLNPGEGIQVKVASIMTKQTSTGITILALVDMIKGQLTNSQLLEKLLIQIARTLGKDYKEATRLTFSDDLAKESIRFFDSLQIPRISRNDVPIGVTNVKFQVQL